MTESKVYELLHELMGECWEWAYDKPENAYAPISITLSGSSIPPSDQHPSKALSPILSSVLGNVTSLRLLSFPN